ncbi:MAG: hypothetical protein ACRCVV_15085, partial [Shewanella sp.]
ARKISGEKLKDSNLILDSCCSLIQTCKGRVDHITAKVVARRLITIKACSDTWLAHSATPIYQKNGGRGV